MPAPTPSLPASVQRAIVRAERAEAFRRDLAWLDAAPLRRIARLPVVALSLRRFAILAVAGSPFVCGGPVTASAVAQFLWILSPQFVLGDRRAARAFAAGIAETVKFLPAVRAIDRYLDDAWADRPARGGGGASGPSIASFVATWVDLLAHQYGWADDAILELPLARVYQLARCIDRRLNPDQPAFASPAAERLKGEWLRKTRAAKARRQAKAKGVNAE